MSDPSQRLILLFDGTWNDPQDRTNVYHLARHLEDHDEHGVRQRFFYEPGVGTRRWERLLGGAFGWRLSRNLRNGYDWLARHYTAETELFIFGFSRGAYTARSLVGMLRKCGLLRIATPALIKQAESLYRDKTLAPGDAVCQRFRERYSREVTVDFIGVWDTVGALGIPGTNFSKHGHFAWHDTELCSIVRRAYQAMALDEHRRAYDVTLWTHPEGARKPSQWEVEQRWFIGAHANVGGGYTMPGDERDPLAGLAYAWLADRARAAGLALRVSSVPGEAYRADPRDSYAEFMKGLYRWYHALRERGGSGRHHRRYDRDPEGRSAVGVSVDPSVWRRWRTDEGYRPPTLVRAECLPPPTEGGA
ncbi:MAG: DUF2235 domain-containing protein [Pseudomonadota bacterium]